MTSMQFIAYAETYISGKCDMLFLRDPDARFFRIKTLCVFQMDNKMKLFIFGQ